MSIDTEIDQKSLEIQLSPEQELSNVQNKIIETENNLDILMKHKHDLKKQLVELTESQRQAEHVLSVLRINEKIKTRAFYKSLRGQ